MIFQSPQGLARADPAVAKYKRGLYVRRIYLVTSRIYQAVSGDTNSGGREAHLSMVFHHIEQEMATPGYARLAKTVKKLNASKCPHPAHMAVRGLLGEKFETQ